MDEESRAVVPKESETELAVRPPDELAADAAKVIDLIAERLKLETPHPSTARRVRGARTVPREFVVSLIAMVERHPEYPFLAHEFDSAKATEVLESADAYRLLAERTAMFLASVNYTVEAQWANVVAQAMQTFTMASIVAESPQHAELAAEIETLRRILGRKGVRKKKTAKQAGEPE